MTSPSVSDSSTGSSESSATSYERDHLGANGRDRAEHAFQRLSRTAAPV